MSRTKESTEVKLTKRGGLYYAGLRAEGGGRVSLRTMDPEVARRRMMDEYQRFVDAQGGRGGTLEELYLHCQTTLWRTLKDQHGLTYRWARVAEFFGPECQVGDVDRVRM